MSEASPRFRQDLRVSHTEADGVACVDVSDPKTGSNFRLYDFEYQLALQLNGQPVARVTAWASTTYGADLTADGIKEFAARLSELGFLEAEAAGAPENRPGETTREIPVPAAASAATTREMPVPAGVGAAPVAVAEAADSAADEWASPQAAKTAQFVPDPAMLDSPPEKTPVAPLDLSGLAAQPAADGAPAPIPVAPGETAQAIVELPSDALKSEPVAAAPASPTATPVADKPKASWAADLDGALESPDSPLAVAPPAARKDDVALPAPTLPVKAAPPPTGLDERRQPPEPESVVMSGFADGGRRGQAPAGPAKRSRAPIVIAIVALLAAAPGVGYWVTHRHRPAPPQALRVRVMSPSPSAVYRWFSEHGEVTDYETTTLAFANPGRLAELLPAGTEVAAGDVVGKLVGASGLETLLAHDRSRVGFYKQLRESMHAARNAAEERVAETHLEEKQKLVEMAKGGLARYTLVATEPGEIVETLAKIGAPIVPGAPVARVKGRLLHGAFALGPDERAALARMDFCRIEVVGLGPRASNEQPARGSTATATDVGSPDAQIGPRSFDCRPPGDAASRTGKIEIPLPGDVGLVSGQPLRLARRRFDAVFPVPATAVVAEGERRSVWIARNGTAELGPVVVADVSDEDVLVAEGLRVGDQVIVDPPAGLRAGAVVEPSP